MSSEDIPPQMKSNEKTGYLDEFAGSLVLDTHAAEFVEEMEEFRQSMKPI